MFWSRNSVKSVTFLRKVSLLKHQREVNLSLVFLFDFPIDPARALYTLLLETALPAVYRKPEINSLLKFRVFNFLSETLIRARGVSSRDPSGTGFSWEPLDHSRGTINTVGIYWSPAQ